jgi:hypothetical protein
MVSDSTRPALTRRLRRFAQARGWQYLPVLYPPIHPRPGKKSRKIWRRHRLGRWLGPLAPWVLSPRHHAHLVGVTGLPAYCRALAETSGVVTGRFHTACLCLGLETPVAALASNTPKIEALLADAGLDLGLRLLASDQLDRLEKVPGYSPAETAALGRFLADARTRFDELFARLASLA